MRKALITLVAAAALAAPAAASSPLTRPEALAAIGATAPAALGLPHADRVTYERLRVRGHHARAWVEVIEDRGGGRSDDATATALIVKNAYGTVRVHYSGRALERGLAPDPAP